MTGVLLEENTIQGQKELTSLCKGPGAGGSSVGFRRASGGQTGLKIPGYGASTPSSLISVGKVGIGMPLLRWCPGGARCPEQCYSKRVFRKGQDHDSHADVPMNMC